MVEYNQRSYGQYTTNEGKVQEKGAKMDREILMGKITRVLDRASESTLHAVYVLLCRLVAMEGV